MNYDSSRVANFGRDTSKAYARFLKMQDKMVTEINAAIEEGVKPLKIAHDLMGRCSGREECINLLSVLIALAKMEKIPESVVEPFEAGLRQKRV